MARQRNDLLGKLTDAGEEAISRLQDAPGADRLLAVATNMRDRVDELSKKVRGIEEMEKRLKQLERKVDKLGTSSGSRSSSARSTASRSSSAKKSTAARSTAKSTSSKSSGTRKSSSAAGSRKKS